MSDQVSVRHTELVTHVGHVEAIADRVATAAGARVVQCAPTTGRTGSSA